MNQIELTEVEVMEDESSFEVGLQNKIDKALVLKPSLKKIGEILRRN